MSARKTPRSRCGLVLTRATKPLNLCYRNVVTQYLNSYLRMRATCCLDRGPDRLDASRV